MGRVPLRVEKSKSRTGKHAVRELALLVSPEGQVVEARPRLVQAEKPTYVKGEAYRVFVEVPKEWYAVRVRMVKNLRGHVKGFIEVYDSDARLLYRAVYRKLKLRYSKGDPSYSWVVTRVAEYLNLPVKRYNLEPPGSKNKPRRR